MEWIIKRPKWVYCGFHNVVLNGTYMCPTCIYQVEESGKCESEHPKNYKEEKPKRITLKSYSHVKQFLWNIWTKYI